MKDITEKFNHSGWRNLFKSFIWFVMHGIYSGESHWKLGLLVV